MHPSSSAVGIDLGVVRFATLSEGAFYELLPSFRRLAGKPAWQQRWFSREQKLSRKWRKQKEKSTRLHCRIAAARSDYLHKVSRKISKNHAVVVLDNLKVRA